MQWFYILAAYFGPGLFILVFTLARLEIILAVRESVGRKSPWWFAMLAWGLIMGASILLWPILLKGWFAKSKSFRGIFPGGDGYQMIQQRLRMIDGLRREMDGYMSETKVGQAAAQQVLNRPPTEFKKIKAYLFLCPFCGSKKAVQIAYGYPAGDTWQLAADGKVALGGCIITKNSPNRKCPDCNKIWVSGDGEEAFEEEYAIPVCQSGKT